MSQQSQYPSTFYRVSLKAVIRDDQGRVLVNKEGSMDTWNLPGGGWDHGETEHEAIARELYEELGYRGGFSAKPRATATYWLESKQAYLLWIVYDVNTEHMNFRIGEDSTDVAFIHPDEFRRQANSKAEKWIADNL